ncbi:hypothetical protein GCM10029963_07020 [Micromonospora andamanensis]
MDDVLCLHEQPRPAGRPGSRRTVPGGGETIALLSESFTAQTVTALRHLLTAQVAATGLTGDVAEDLVLAVHELVTNAVLHGGEAADSTCSGRPTCSSARSPTTVRNAPVTCRCTCRPPPPRAAGDSGSPIT